MGSKQIKPLAFLGLLLLSLPSLIFSETEIVGPFGNLNNRDNPMSIPANMAQDMLNVDVTPGGRSVKRRKGYGVAFTLSNTTSPVHGVYNFYDSAGNDVSLFFNDTKAYASISGSAYATLFSTGANGATYQCTDSQGQAYCANTGRTSLFRTDGSTYALITSVVSTGTMVSAGPDRLMMSGFAEAPNRIDFSKSADFTTWRPGGNSVDPITFTVTSPGSKVTHITYQNGFYFWWKTSSFGYILPGQNLADWTIRTIDSSVGTLDNSDIWREGILYFRGQDAHIYAWDGAQLTKLTRDIQGTIDATQNRTSNSWTQTSQADWQASSTTPQGALDISVSPGSVVLSTATPISPFVDTSSANFIAGTLTNLSTGALNGSLTLQISTNAFFVYKGTTSDSGSANNLCSGGSGSAWVAFKFGLPGTGFIASSVTIGVCRRASEPSNPWKISIAPDSGGSPGTDLFTDNVSFTSAGICDGSFTPTDLPVDITDTPLSKNTTYWLRIYEAVGCENSTPKNAIWSMDGIASTYTVKTSGGSSFSQAARTTIYGKNYLSTGSIISRSFDVGFTTNTWIWNWSTFVASGSIPSFLSNLTFQTQTSPDGVTFNNPVSVSSGSSPTSTVQRYIRYTSSFTTTDGSTSPIVNDFVLNNTFRKSPFGTLFSQIKNAPNIASWDSFSADAPSNSGVMSFSIRSSTGVFFSSATTPAWTSIANGAIPTISTNPYFQVASSFSITSTSQDPTLNSFTVNWFEGQASDKAYATYFNDANWWSVASGTGATTNNKILKQDLINGGWSIYDIGMNGMYVRNQRLYFGSVSGGYIMKFGDTDSDNSSVITAYWKSKDFFGSAPFLEKAYNRVSCSAAAQSSSLGTITYTVNATSSTAYTVNFTSTTQGFVHFNRNLPIGTNGYNFNLKLGNSAADAPFEWFGCQIDQTTKDWKVTQ